jgi:hypothetical protein
MQAVKLLLSLLALVLLCAGCASYEYDITRPSELARHVGTKDDVVLQRPPLEYRLVTMENRLIMRIYNPNDEPITLLGDRSSVVDPQGQSHPLLSQTMAPHSFIKMILPPLRPRVERVGPSIEFGVGGMISSRHYPRLREYDAIDGPNYLAVYDDTAGYWEWSGEGEIRLTLTFQQGDRTFDHEFVIARRKIK